VWGGEGGAGGVAAREGWGGVLPGPAAVEKERAAGVGAGGTAGRCEQARLGRTAGSPLRLQAVVQLRTSPPQRTRPARRRRSSISCGRRRAACARRSAAPAGVVSVQSFGGLSTPLHFAATPLSTPQSPAQMASVLLPTRGARPATPSARPACPTSGRRVTTMAAKGEGERLERGARGRSPGPRARTRSLLPAPSPEGRGEVCPAGEQRECRRKP